MASAVTLSRGWRIPHWRLAALFIVVGVLALYRPQDTFVGLAAVMSFCLVFRGVFDIATSLAATRVS
jgi:uncharacterized membrane protein HdeD (DUF308 family)